MGEDKSLLASKPSSTTEMWPMIENTMMREPEHHQGIFSYFDKDSVPEQSTDYSKANLVAHAKVYAIAEQ